MVRLYTRMKALLFCLHCNKDTEHTITYAGDIIKSIKCEECGTELELNRENIIKEYTGDFIERVLTKPHRMTKELEKDIGEFLFSLPIRIITKPYRLFEEVKEITMSKKKDEKDK